MRPFPLFRHRERPAGGVAGRAAIQRRKGLAVVRGTLDGFAPHAMTEEMRRVL